MQSEFQKIFQEIQADPDNESFTKQAIKPLYYASSSARINIIGQATGRIAQEKMKFWDDPSGNLLKDEDHNKTYEIVNGKFIYLRGDNFQHIDGKPYVWYS